MSTEQKIYLFLSFAISLFAIVCYFPTIYGDSAIYFTFIKNFTSLPFSYQPETVSYGASSPLLVVMLSPLHLFFSSYWLECYKCLSILFLIIGSWLIIMSYAQDWKEVFFCITLVTLNAPLMFATAAVFETGLIVLFFGMSIWAYNKSFHTILLLITGLFHLIRPELLILGVGVQVYILYRHSRTLQTVIMTVLSYIPMVTYYLYMFHHSGSFLPSSVFGRAINAIENKNGWLFSMLATLKVLFLQPVNVIYVVIAIAVIFVVLNKTLRVSVYGHLLLMFSTLLPFAVSPPMDYAPRYFIPAAILSIPVSLYLLRSFNSQLLKNIIVYTLTIVSIGLSFSAYSVARRYEIDTLMLSDLAIIIKQNRIESNAPILMYEMQAQYTIEQPLLSADGIVGNHMHNFLLGKESLSNAINRNGIQYIVTMNSFNYRPIFRNTELEKLYVHDLVSRINDTVVLNSIHLTKIGTNPIFSDSSKYILKEANNLNTGRFLRVYNLNYPKWQGHHPLWNSIYKITPSPSPK